VSVAEGGRYRAAAVATAQCELPWPYLQSIAGASLGTATDIKGVIDGSVPALLRPMVDRDPDTTCADALAAPAVAERPTARHVRTDDGQPFPLYGIVTVSRS
jgi:hypothetical protein